MKLKVTKKRREHLYAQARRFRLLTNQSEFIKLAPIWLEMAGIELPNSKKTLYNDWTWITEQEMDISDRRDEASRLVTMAEDMAIENEDPGTMLRAAELIMRHANPHTPRGGGQLSVELNKTADIANSFGTAPPGPAEPPEEVQEWMDQARQRDGEA